jgi:hypothetical protein
VTERDRQLLDYYMKNRVEDQLTFYRTRRQQFERATGQALALSAMLLGFSSAASALAGADNGWTGLWTTLATILPAASTALSAFIGLYAFEQRSKIYGDTIRAVHTASRLTLTSGADSARNDVSIAELVQRVEAAMRQEQAQWGQLTGRFDVVKPRED